MKNLHSKRKRDTFWFDKNDSQQINIWICSGNDWERTPWYSPWKVALLWIVDEPSHFRNHHGFEDSNFFALTHFLLWKLTNDYQPEMGNELQDIHSQGHQEKAQQKNIFVGKGIWKKGEKLCNHLKYLKNLICSKKQGTLLKLLVKQNDHKILNRKRVPQKSS